VPQHGRIYTGDNIKRFLDWFEVLESRRSHRLIVGFTPLNALSYTADLVIFTKVGRCCKKG